MTSTNSVLADTLNAAFGLSLASFAEAKQWFESPEGEHVVDAWRVLRDDAGSTGTDDERITAA